MQTSVCVDARSLEYFPVQLFAIIMGLSGFAIVFAKAYHILDFSYWFYAFILFIDTLLFLVIFTSYMLKIASYPEAVKGEINHPIKSSFMASISVSLLLLSIAYYDFAPTLSIVLWFIATPLQLFFTLVVMKYWIHNDLEVVHSNPAWFIPIVGNVLVPVVGVDAAPIFVSLFFFSLGMFFWIVLFTIMINRIIFHNPLAKKLIPTFFIFIAPPAVGFVSYLKITNGSIDMFSIFLYSIALFTLLLLLFMLRMYDVKMFFISWWAYTFPLAAITIATLLMHNIYHSTFTYIASLSLIAFLTLVVGYVALKTIQAFKAQKICISEE
ncbi:C4-dicarboxylate ABC transporter [Sulfurimonas hongkongensis]|uniref:C4-dicarboxylate ABC transporter n=1 Tax=Sulfurimonas hongkongensis TaxID=1172190 RepID=T0L0L1_9BACT|nr:SLAC1 anion channel family protein [Sulfurimonas hongkongensis]EQB39313.1 C4-dicarboxylate ABC transporter [Sulfurimonas hongkongensis]